MKASIRAATEKVFEWISVGAGLLILGSCTYSGFATTGVMGAVGAFLLALLCAALLIAFVFMLTRTSADIRAIRDRLDPPGSRKPADGPEARP